MSIEAAVNFEHRLDLLLPSCLLPDGRLRLPLWLQRPNPRPKSRVANGKNHPRKNLRITILERILRPSQRRDIMRPSRPTKIHRRSIQQYPTYRIHLSSLQTPANPAGARNHHGILACRGIQVLAGAGDVLYPAYVSREGMLSDFGAVSGGL